MLLPLAAASSSLVGMEGFEVVGGLSRFFFSFGFLFGLGGGVVKQHLSNFFLSDLLQIFERESKGSVEVIYG